MIKEAMSSDHIINVWDRTYKERLFDPHNKVVISGIVEEELEFNYRQKSTKINFYKTVVASIESSGRVNKIMIALSETIKNNIPTKKLKGKYIEASGKLRCYRGEAGDGHRFLRLYVLISKINVYDERKRSKDINEVYLDGYVCKEVVTLKTTMKTDYSIVVNRKKNWKQSDFFPCVARGRFSAYIKYLNPGDRVKFIGRIQSRIYPIGLSNGKEEWKEVNEVRLTKMIEI